MGGSSSPPPPPAVEPVPTAVDVEAAEERARLYGLLRGRRGARGLAFGARRRSLLAPATEALLGGSVPAAPAYSPAPAFGAAGEGALGSYGGFGGFYDSAFGGSEGGYGRDPSGIGGAMGGGVGSSMGVGHGGAGT